MSDQGSTRRREVARRAFASEFNDSTHLFKESDDERAPKYTLLRTGVKANRFFIIGTLSETMDVGEESEYWQGRVVDPTGTFFVYAGEYQQAASDLLAEIDPPEYVAVVGKPRRFETDAGSINMSIRPESIVVVEQVSRQRWIVETATRTIERIEDFNTKNSRYIEMATEEYGTDISQYHRDTIRALESLDDKFGSS